MRGLNQTALRGRHGILFLPNHPALIDPVIVTTYLHAVFAPRPLADKDQVDRFFIRRLARRVGVRPLPDLRKYGHQVRGEIDAVVQDCMRGLRAGENLLLYPAGHIYHSRHEDLRGNSAVEAILREVPQARVVLVRTRGLWGSGFSLASGQVPNVGQLVRRAVRVLLGNFLLLAPRRAVTIELVEPDDVPRAAPRNELNSYLERFYNHEAPPARYVPCSHWESGGPRDLPEPEFGQRASAAAGVPQTTRRLVLEYLGQLAGRADLRDDERLAQDLGLDSLAKAELVLWLAREFGLTGGDVDALQTVGDVLLAARGESVVVRPVELRPPPATWTRGLRHRRAEIPPGDDLLAVFLAQARSRQRQAALADAVSGVRTYRDILTAIHALRPLIAALPGEHVGILLPASVAAGVTYLAALAAGKVPVMLNWTTGARNMAHALELTGTRHVLTVGPLVRRLESQGIDLSALRERFVLLEDLRAHISRIAKLRAYVRARLGIPFAPVQSKIQNPKSRMDCGTAVILLTSGSESLPKAVPLTHANLLANVRDVLRVLTVYEDDVLMGFLPPFHSFGLTVTLLLPLLAGARTVYHANPTEAWTIAKLIRAYRATLVCGTPTFLAGILRAAGADDLATLRLAVTGAERCPERVYQALVERCRDAVVLEGYGVTECGPIIAVNRPERPRPGTLGEVLPSLEWAIVDVDTGRPMPPGETGMLLVRGPSVFPGYLGDEVASPFVEHADRTWYRTGDLVSADADGVLTFRGRLKRFVKLGGEMVSLPAIEAVLEPHYGGPADEGPVLAVEATPSEDHPEIVLFTTRDLDRAAVNAQIRAAGLSPLHNITRVVRMEQIPVLGTGKTDYRALRALLHDGEDKAGALSSPTR